MGTRQTPTATAEFPPGYSPADSTPGWVFPRSTVPWPWCRNPVSLMRSETRIPVRANTRTAFRHQSRSRHRVALLGETTPGIPAGTSADFLDRKV
jgi:hypothetical protein